VTYLERLLALTPETPEASTVPKPIHPGGPGLWRHKHLEAPPYIQHVAQALMRNGHSESDAYHMAVGIIKNWARGRNGKHKVHKDVQAAAVANVAKWEETRARAHAETAAGKLHQKSDHDVAATRPLTDAETLSLTALLAEWAEAGTCGLDAFLRMAVPDGTAPGARPLAGRLWQAPSQTVSPSPPLPPDVGLPTPQELDALGSDIRAAGTSDLLRGAADQAHAAAMKMRAKQPKDALHLLRAVQAGVVSAHREFNASQLPVANVFSASLLPAEQSSARSEMYEGLRTREKYRALASRVAQHIDRIRRTYFHGMYGGLAEARLSRLDAVTALAAPGPRSGMIYVQVPSDQLPPGATGSKPGHVTVCYLGDDVGDAQYLEACDRARAAARATAPIHAILGGLGIFPPSLSSGGAAVAYVPVHASGLGHLRELLSDLCAPGSLPFRPHLTLGYLAPGQDPPPPATSTRVCFSQLLVARGDQVCAFALTGRGGVHPAGRRLPS
jgi:hypothetical protein